MQETQLSSLDRSGRQTPDDGAGVVAAPRNTRRRRWIGIGIGVLAAMAAPGLVLAWLRWGKYDPSQVGVQIPESQAPWYSLVLLLQVMGVCVAIATCGFQISKRMRRSHPVAQRYLGRVYLGAVYVAVVFATVQGIFWAYSVVTTISQVVFLPLWAAVTTYAFVLRRQGRIVDERRWMLRSFGLTVSIVVELLLDPLIIVLLDTELHSRYGGSMDIYMQMKDSTLNWLSLVIVLLAVEWWLERDQLRRSVRS
jgi:hypothetical protein